MKDDPSVPNRDYTMLNITGNLWGSSSFRTGAISVWPTGQEFGLAWFVLFNDT